MNHEQHGFQETFSEKTVKDFCVEIIEDKSWQREDLESSAILNFFRTILNLEGISGSNFYIGDGTFKDFGLIIDYYFNLIYPEGTTDQDSMLKKAIIITKSNFKESLWMQLKVCQNILS